MQPLACPRLIQNHLHQNKAMDLEHLPRYQLHNQHLQIEALTEGGLRLIALRLPNSTQNLLAESPNNHWPTPYGEYHLLGGHRLWVAPETPERTYIPDTGKIQIEETGNGLRLTAAIEEPTGLQKSIHLQPDPQHPAIDVTHTIANRGKSSIEVSAWAITALPLGGRAILPQPIGPSDGLQPNRHLTLWPYTRIQDRRLKLNDDWITLQAASSLPPCKIGYLNTHGWIAYQRDGVLFVKRFEVHASQPHPDRNCNVEVYCNDVLIELETLSPSVCLLAGKTITHTERWEIYQSENLPPEFDSLPV